MKTAYQKTDALYTRLQKIAPNITRTQAETLRKAELTLQRWAELECGDGNDYSSWAIERDETTGIPYKCVYPHTGKSYKTRIADKERGALRRIESLCKELGIHYFHQGDCRGCMLYVSNVALSDSNYSSFGIACCS